MGMIDPMDGRNCYPESKRLAEAMFRSYNNQYGVPFLVLVVGFVIWRMRVKHRRKIRIEYASTDERETMSMEEGKKKNDK